MQEDVAGLSLFLRDTYDFYAADWVRARRANEALSNYPTSALRAFESHRSTGNYARLRDLLIACPPHRFEIDLGDEEHDSSDVSRTRRQPPLLPSKQRARADDPRRRVRPARE